MHNKYLLEGSGFQEEYILGKVDTMILGYIYAFYYFYLICITIPQALNALLYKCFPGSYHMLFCEPLGNSSLCPIKHYSFFFFSIAVVETLWHIRQGK